jgi:hypothetical protein
MGALSAQKLAATLKTHKESEVNIAKRYAELPAGGYSSEGVSAH